MILRSLKVQGWRCLHDSVEVGPLTDGINVIHAPNATGKTTLFQALQHAMLDGHRVKSQGLELIRPWGRDLAPTVTVEFSHDGFEYQLTKRFLDNPLSELRRKEGGRFVRLADGDQADLQVRALLSKTAPGRGLAGSEHWGLAQVLWAPQGNLALPSLSGELVADIQRMLGAQMSGPESNPIERKIEERYLTYYTPKGKPRSGREGPKVASIEEQLSHAMLRQQEQRQRQEDFEDLTRQVEDRQAVQAEANRSAQGYERKLADKRPEAVEYARLQSEATTRQEQANAAQAQHDALRRRLDAIKYSRKRLEKTRGEIASLKGDAELREREIAQRRQEVEKATTTLENVRRDRPKERQAREEAELARKYLDAKEKADRLQKRLAKLRELFQALQSRKQERSKILAPDDKTLRAIRETLTDRDKARIRLEAALITVQVVARKDGALEVVEGEDLGTRALADGYSVEVKGSPQVVVELPGIARIRASGPAGSIKQLRAAVERYSNEVMELTREYGTAEIGILEKLSADAATADKEVADVETQVGSILSGESLDTLEQEFRKHLAIVSGVLTQRPLWEASPPDILKLQESAEAVRQEFLDRVDPAERAWESAQKTLNAAHKAQADTAALIAGAEKSVRDLTETLNRLAGDAKDDADLERQLGDFALKWDAAVAGLRDVQNKLRKFETDPRTDIEKLEGLLRGEQARAKKALADEKTAEGRLQTLAAQGTYSVLAEADEEVASLRVRLANEQLNMHAAGLLYEVFTQCRQEALAQVSGPVERTASDLLRRMAGGRLGPIQLGEAFNPAHVLPEAMHEPVAIENASGGEREQIYLATRLALAEVLARRERQLVVLDDVLTATDSGRLARVLTVLEEAAQRLQIVVLTCHPERYGALDQAKFIDLELLVKG